MWKSCEKALHRVSTGLRKENFHIVFFSNCLSKYIIFHYYIEHFVNVLTANITNSFVSANMDYASYTRFIPPIPHRDKAMTFVFQKL